MLSQAITFTYQPQHHRPENVAIHPQPIPFKLLTWWLLKSNGLSAALFWGSQNGLCMHKHYFALPPPAFHPSFHFSACAFTLSVCTWEDSGTLPSLSPPRFNSSLQLRRERGLVHVYLWAQKNDKASQVIIWDSHCVSSLMRWRLIARSGQQLFWAGWQKAQREDGSRRRGGRSEYQQKREWRVRRHMSQ